MTTYWLRDTVTGEYYPHEISDSIVADMLSNALEKQTGHRWEISTIAGTASEGQPTSYDDRDQT